MSAKLQEEASQGRSTARKLPQFPAKKGSAPALASSPAKAPRDEHLPEMPTSTQAGRAQPDMSSRRGASGADKLAQLSKQGPGAGADDALGFDSPRRGTVRAQVARDEVLSYMRRQKAEPRDTSFDDDDTALPAHTGTSANAGTSSAARPDASSSQLGQASDSRNDGSLSFSLDFMEAYRTRPSTAAAPAAAARELSSAGAPWAGSGHGAGTAEPRGGAAAAGPARGGALQQQGLRGSESFDAEELLRRYSVGRGRLGGSSPAGWRGQEESEEEGDEVEEEIADDTAAVSGPDQSPTRHTPSGVRTAGTGGASRARPSSAAARPAQPAATPNAAAAAAAAAARALMSRSRAAAPAASGGGGVLRMSLSIAAAVASPLASSVALTDDAFELFKRDIAARVIQVHWRRWVAWKAKVRRDAEQRILQQLFADDPSGLSLKLLLGEVGGASGDQGGGNGPKASSAAATEPAPHSTAGGARLTGTGTAPAATATGGALEKQPSGTRLPALKRPASPSRAGKGAASASGMSSVDAMGHLPAAAGAAPGSGASTPRKSAAAAGLATMRAGNGKGDGSGAGGGRSGTPGKRPVSAADAYAQARTESILADDRSRRRPNTAGAALVGSPGRARGAAAAAGPALEDSLDVEDTEWQEALEYDENEDNPHAVRATPRKTHKGGHAVYTFVATPRRRAAAEAAAAAAAAQADDAATKPDAEPDSGTAWPPAQSPTAPQAKANTGADALRVSRHQPYDEAEAVRPPAQKLPQQPQPQQQPPVGRGQEQEQQPAAQPCQLQKQEKLQLREPSLDADANPAMASPALSALTGEAGGAVAGAAGADGGSGAMAWAEDDAQSRPSGLQQRDSGDVTEVATAAPQADAASAGQQEQRQASSGRRMEALQRLRQQGSQRALGLSSSGAAVPTATGAAPMASSEGRADSKEAGERASRHAPQPEHSSHQGHRGADNDEARSHPDQERQRGDAGTSGRDHQNAARADVRRAVHDHGASRDDDLEASLRSMGERNRRAAGAGHTDDRHDRRDSHQDQLLPSRHAPHQPHAHAPHPPADQHNHVEQHHRRRERHHAHHRDSIAVDDRTRPLSAAPVLDAGNGHTAEASGREDDMHELAGPSGRGQQRPASASAFAAAPQEQPPPQQQKQQPQQQSARAQQLRQSRHPGRRVFTDSDESSEEDDVAVEEPATARHAQQPPRRHPESPGPAPAPSHQSQPHAWAERRRSEAPDEARRDEPRAAARDVYPGAPTAAVSSSQPPAAAGRPSGIGVERDDLQLHQPQTRHQAASDPHQRTAAVVPEASAGQAPPPPPPPPPQQQQQQQQQLPPQQAARRQPQQPPQVEVAASLTVEKMTSILKYLDEVELQAEQEAACATVAPALLLAEPSTAAALAAMAAMPSGPPGSRPATAAAASMRSRGASAGPTRPSTSHAAGGAQIMTQRSLAALSDAPGGRSRHPRPYGRSQSHARGMAASRRSGFDHEYDNDEGRGLTEDWDEDGGDDDLRDADAASVGAASGVSGLTTGRPAFLAESVYESVRAKIRRLQEDVAERDDRIEQLSQEVEALTSAQRSMALEADARLSELLAAQRAEYEGAVARHLAFVDRLLADKEALTARAEQLEAAVKGADDKQERAIAKLKEGWAAELRRQKEGWAAAEKQRREAWMSAKAAEIKDMTVKGLEGEVQKLLARHKAELSAAQQAAADEARRHLDTYVAQNEAAVRQLKERMAREAEEAVEKERASAGVRLREVSERYEQQLQTQRMRLVSDADLRLEQLEQARKEDKKRYEEALGAAREAAESRQRDMEEDWRREKEALRKAHDKQIESLREQYETGQEGWRAAMAERARKEVAERVAAIREKLLEERNAEIQAVMARLEEEHAAAVESLKEDFRRREEAAAAKAAAALKEAKRAEVKMAERFRCAGAAAQMAEERVAAAELAASELRRELEQRNSTIRWLEGQVSVAKEEATARERDLRSLGADKAAVAAEAAAAANRERQAVETRLAAAQQEVAELRNKHGAEMAHVEARVKATLARKDDVIAGLREQLSALASELRGTQEILRQQQEELGR
ncbi:hypothetical protein HYH02_001049 [Chlamydomonas schloesseri]|uniref:Centrosomal protein of 131 kDa n=1 Tax=Chlamydomonas schloesseri TaxID=2026947 RepID=A0A835WWP5_9CHLO|nr:hypothetical protein HYH02_001049 [Chlamydomonas schloesseri]|eukprot:KAG2454006.1 hypothetical protein HYH02_001049 [Chlamydomonas schloesseri]